MKKYTKKIKEKLLSPLELFQNPLISSVMLQLASFEWGLKQRELLEILNKKKDGNKGKGVRWAINQLQQHNLVEIKKTIGHVVQIKNNPNDNENNLEQIIIGTTDSPAERIVFKNTPANAPIEYYFKSVEEKIPEKEKLALQEIKSRILELHLPLTNLYSLNQNYPDLNIKTPQKIGELIKELEKELDLTTDPIRKQTLEKEINIQKIDLEHFTEIIQKVNSTYNEYLEKEKKDNKELLRRQRKGEFTYSKWLVNELEGIILIDIYNRINRPNGLYKSINNQLIPFTIEDKIHFRTIMEVCIGMILDLDKDKQDDILLFWLKQGIVNILDIPFTKEELELKRELINAQKEANEKSREWEEKRKKFE